MVENGNCSHQRVKSKRRTVKIYLLVSNIMQYLTKFGLVLGLYELLGLVIQAFTDQFEHNWNYWIDLFRYRIAKSSVVHRYLRSISPPSSIDCRSIARRILHWLNIRAALSWKIASLSVGFTGISCLFNIVSGKWSADRSESDSLPTNAKLTNYFFQMT